MREGEVIYRAIIVTLFALFTIVLFVSVVNM